MTEEFFFLYATIQMPLINKIELIGWHISETLRQRKSKDKNDVYLTEERKSAKQGEKDISCTLPRKSRNQLKILVH